MIVLLNVCGFMSSNLFEKILKIVQVVVTLLEMAVKAFTGIGDEGKSDSSAEMD